MKDELITILKKYVMIFLNEYSAFLSKNDIELLKNINYEDIFVFDDLSIPFGTVFLNKIYLSNSNDELLNRLKSMPNYNSLRRPLNSKNLSSYLKYMCDNGYNLLDFYSDILMYFIFSLIIKNNSFLINGFINQEMQLLSIKYNLRIAPLYAREEKIISKITPIFKFDGIRKMLFMDMPTCFKYINDNYGYRYAKMVNDIFNIVNDKYNEVIKNKDYIGINGIIEYTNNYDYLSYSDVYNYFLDFEVENSFINQY